jgi:shikimate dehydrogenase
MVKDLNAGKIARVVPWDRREARSADLLVNATPLGLKARDPLPASARIVRHAAAAVDLVVRPRGTRWIALARSYGLHAEEGSVMLIAQGRESFRLWFGKRPPFAVMERALREASGERR